ncbi:hypothetical protein SAY86_001790 [Trapa natans]|uniref:PWWP domain-containing protein n=1 Tax=Trapa natans TaxID=22666 RepID=A0AAN7R2Q0_TRANT|nr:hypothetical protein SAY86_001790 [Trapa natans]
MGEPSGSLVRKPTAEIDLELSHQMGGSSSEPSSNNKGIDASVGGLVWVRRRNGSWWPGRIVGLDELSEDCLVSPRSGTPVQLLGREDASIDWYNLEKSKRVKAFRCGEYDDCIEKAKTAAANSSKKAVKYARREDAILHALEIESTRLGKDPPYYFNHMDSLSGRLGTSATGSPTISHSVGKETNGISEDEVDGEFGSTPGISHSGSYLDEPSHASSIKGKTDREMRRRTPNDSEDDGDEGAKRMRGLEDLGMGVVPYRKNQPETLQLDNGSVHDLNACNDISNGSQMNGGKGHSSSSLKRKRSQVAHVHDFLKRKNRRRPLTKVLESTAMVSVPITCDQLATSCGSPLGVLSDAKTARIEFLESKRRFSSAVVEKNPESTGLAYENETLTNSAENANTNTDQVDIHHKIKNEPSCLLDLSENVQTDGLFDVPFISEDKKSSGFPSIYTSCSPGRSQIGFLGRQSNQSQSSKAQAVSLHHEALNESVVSACSTATHVDNVTQRIVKSTSKWQSKGKRNSRDLGNKKRRRSIGMSSIAGGSTNPDAYMADLDFNQKENLNNKLDRHLFTLPGSKDKKLTGVCDWGKRTCSLRVSQTRKPSQLKILSEASVTPKRLLPYRQSRYTVNPRYETDEFSIGIFGSNSESSLYDIELQVNATYRPPHVPLVSLMSKLNGKAIVGHPLAVEVLENDDFNVVTLDGLETRLGTERSSDVIMVSGKKNASQSHFSARKKPKSEKSGLSKKMRKLSSLTIQKRGEDNGRPLEEKPGSSVIACIPLKVVFSRINEAVTGSVRLTNRSSTA